ncbi:hypothetical protein CLOM_g15751 [Closterium sp. NIES-68]|nr:hypothetical protein CLOM_g15751 [Closterium sp. NIES-68]
MDWFHYMLLGLNALLLVLFIARSAPQHWVVPAASGAGEAASAEGAIAGGVSLRMSAWGESGELCAFRVSVRAPAHWAEEVLQARKRSWWKRELTVTMRGAASGAGDVRCLDPPRCREMSVAYRLWDVGEYFSSSRSLASGATADYPAPQSDQISPEKPTPSLPHLQATTPHLNPPEANPRLGSLLPANPCAGTSVPTRWKLSNGTYHWTPYFCAHRELPPGTTTQRETQFPNISSTADVTLFEGGYWGASFCRQPLKSLRPLRPGKAGRFSAPSPRLW